MEVQKIVKLRVKKSQAVNGTPSHSYGVSPATQHNWTCTYTLP